jgi:tight adherence protein B
MGGRWADVSRAVLLAFGSGTVAIAAAWELVLAVEQNRLLQASARVLAPLRAAYRHGREPDAEERRRLGALLALTLLGGGLLLAGPVPGVLAAAAGPWLLGRALQARRARFAAALADGAPDAARALADALAGGHSIRGAVMEVARNGGTGTATDTELSRCAAALALGEPTERVLDGLRSRARHPAWDTIVAAILLQRDAGGDLALLLRALAADLDAGVRAEAEARAATAQARMTAQLVMGLPAAAAVLGELANPGLLAGLIGHPVARLLVLLAVALQAVALTLVHRLARPVAR